MIHATARSTRKDGPIGLQDLIDTLCGIRVTQADIDTFACRYPQVTWGIPCPECVKILKDK